MKTTLKLTTLLVGLALVFGTSCGKYEEGPGISFKSKAARLANTWIVDKYENAGGDIQQENNSATFEFTKDGKLSITTGSITNEGTWEFISNKEKLRTTIFGSTDEGTIVQLKSKEMILKDEDGDKTYFVQK